MTGWPGQSRAADGMESLLSTACGWWAQNRDLESTAQPGVSKEETMQCLSECSHPPGECQGLLAFKLSLYVWSGKPFTPALR